MVYFPYGYSNVFANSLIGESVFYNTIIQNDVPRHELACAAAYISVMFRIWDKYFYIHCLLSFRPAISFCNFVSHSIWLRRQIWWFIFNINGIIRLLFIGMARQHGHFQNSLVVLALYPKIKAIM